MGKKIFYFLLVLISHLCFGGSEVQKSDSLTPEVQKTDSIKKGAKISFKTFIPGAVQYSKGQKTKAWMIIGSEVISLLTGSISWYLSDEEYNKYLSLPKGTPKEEFDRHHNNSNLYGTISIGSFVGFGTVYLYSVIDGLLLSHRTENYGLYLVPKQEGVALSAIIKF